tara:strand:- start:1052 stop:1549 length:498 start_codon:yes stop_codon:yes gene_type:complete
MKKVLLSIVAAVILFSCSTVKTDPAKFTLTVINNTDQDMKWAQTWAITGPDSGVVLSGDTVLLSSNETGGDEITIIPLPPDSVTSPNPTNGIFQMTYGWDGHIARIYADNDTNKGNPMDSVCYGCNWVYETSFLLPSSVETNATNTVTFTTRQLYHSFPNQYLNY